MLVMSGKLNKEFVFSSCVLIEVGIQQVNLGSVIQISSPWVFANKHKYTRYKNDAVVSKAGFCKQRLVYHKLQPINVVQTLTPHIIN